MERDENRPGIALSEIERSEERDSILPVFPSGKEGTWLSEEGNIL
jgi:hypothetical protein